MGYLGQGKVLEILVYINYLYESVLVSKCILIDLLIIFALH